MRCSGLWCTSHVNTSMSMFSGGYDVCLDDKWRVHDRAGVFDDLRWGHFVHIFCQLNFKVPLRSELSFSCWSSSWLFGLPCEEWCIFRVWQFQTVTFINETVNVLCAHWKSDLTSQIVWKLILFIPFSIHKSDEENLKSALQTLRIMDFTLKLNLGNEKYLHLLIFCNYSMREKK